MRRGDLLAPALLGVAGGCRAFSPPAALVLRGRGPRGLPGRLLIGAAALELVYDKLPLAPSRLRPEGLAARGVSSGLSGAALAGPPGAGVAAGVALGAAFAGHRSRAGLTAARPRGALLWAALEDAAAVGLAAAATGPGAERRSLSNGEPVGARGDWRRRVVDTARRLIPTNRRK